MTESKDTILVWTDIETTGLYPHTDAILEVAIVLTNSKGSVEERLCAPGRPYDIALAVELFSLMAPRPRGARRVAPTLKEPDT